MAVRRRLVCLIVCLQLVTNVEFLRGGESMDPQWRCPPTDDGACIPNPKSYGYYPTRWRKWPGAKIGPEPISTPKAGTPSTAGTTTTQGPAIGTEELPPSDAQLRTGTGTGDEQPDLMPSDPTRPATKPDLAPELKSDLPQPPDLESLLPEEGPDEVPAPPPAKFPPSKAPASKSPPARPESKPIPKDDDPFQDDPLPGDAMEGAAHPRSHGAATTTVKTHAQPKTLPNGDNPLRSDSSAGGVMHSTNDSFSPVAPAAKGQPHLRPEPTSIPANEDPFKDDPLPGDDMGNSGPPAPPAPTTTGKMHWRPDPRLQQAGRGAEPKNPIILADAQNLRGPSVRPVAITASSAKVSSSRTNPLRSATSGMVLPGPMAEPDDVIPATNWSPESASTQVQPTAAADTPETAAVPAAASPGESTVRRVNPLRGGR